MKTRISILFLFVTTLGFSQISDSEFASRATMDQVMDITNAYNKQLALDGDQLPIFRKTIQDYLILSTKIKEELKGKAKLEALTKLRINQALDMENILTREQFELYKMICQDIQPLEIVAKEKISKNP